MSEERWMLFNVRMGNFKCLLIQKSIPNAYFFSFRWFLIYLITTPAVFLNQTHLVRLGIFHIELGKKHTFWLWEWGRISAPNFGDREPCDHRCLPWTQNNNTTQTKSYQMTVKKTYTQTMSLDMTALPTTSILNQ